MFYIKNMDIDGNNGISTAFGPRRNVKKPVEQAMTSETLAHFGLKGYDDLG